MGELVQLGKKKRIPVMADLGCGEIFDLSSKGIPKSIMIQDIVKTGAGIITFSGDKLLGGPQAGLIVGKKKLVSRLKNNPIARAVRCDKWTISFLNEALRSFVDDGPSKNNLTNLLLTTSRKSLKKKGEKILSLLTKKKIKDLAISLVNSEVEVGIVNELALVTVTSYNPPARFVPVNPVNVKFLMLFESLHNHIFEAAFNYVEPTCKVI